MHETLLRDLYNLLQRVFDPKPLNPKLILLILNEYIYSNPIFKETEPDLTSYIADLKLGIKVSHLFLNSFQNSAVERYHDRREEFFNESSLDLIQVHDFADAFISDIERIHKRFKDPILG